MRGDGWRPSRPHQYVQVLELQTQGRYCRGSSGAGLGIAMTLMSAAVCLAASNVLQSSGEHVYQSHLHPASALQAVARAGTGWLISGYSRSRTNFSKLLPLTGPTPACFE